MFGNYYYHQRIRKAVATFGAMFNDIYVLRKDSGGGVVSTVKVPLSYGPRAKFLDRIREVPLKLQIYRMIRRDNYQK